MIRGQKVMLDSDLAEIYQVPTKRLNEAVKRNLARFPEDFMFQLSHEEFENWRSQVVTSNPGAKMGMRRPPYAFTEHGAAMLSAVLNSERAAPCNWRAGNSARSRLSAGSGRPPRRCYAN